MNAAAAAGPDQLHDPRAARSVERTHLLLTLLTTLAAWFIWGINTAGLIPSSERATVPSFDSMMGSTGGMVAPPFLVLARHEPAVSDPIAGPVPHEAAGS